MKAFVIRFFRFIFLFGLILAGIFCLIFLKKQETYTIKKHNIIIGDSNTRWGINDSILNNYQNFLKAFTDEFGISPKKYLKSLEKNKV